MSGSLMILGCFVLGVLLAWLGWIPDYFLEHDGTLYVLYVLMFLVGISIGHDRRLGEILRTLRPRVLLLPLATTVGTFAGAALASITLAYSLSECLAVGSGFAYYSLSSIFITQYKGAELGTVALLSVLGVLGTRIYQTAAYGGAAPEILFASDVISVPTGADDAALLAGVTATDAEVPLS